MSIAGLINSVITFYMWVIIIYVLMSWLPPSGFVVELQQVLGTIVEPYLGLFRRFIPPIGAIDISPIVAILVLQVVARLVLTAL